MRYRTHVVITLAIALPIMEKTDTVSLGTTSALLLGCLLPDIDERASWIGCRTLRISNFLNKIFRQKDVTHSLFFLILVLMTMGLLVSLINFNALLAIYFTFGYALHLIEDGFSKNGVRWLLPFTNKSFRFGKDFFYYTTGGPIENVIFYTSIFTLILESILLFL